MYRACGGGGLPARRNREPPPRRCCAMADESPDQKSPIESAEPIIAQCRRESAAGWTQVEAARAELKRTRVLHDRWSELMQAAAAAAAAAAATSSRELSHDRPRADGVHM